MLSKSAENGFGAVSRSVLARTGLQTAPIQIYIISHRSTGSAMALTAWMRWKSRWSAN